MDSSQQIKRLKRILRDEVASFCRQDDVLWKKGVLKTLVEIKERNWNAVFFGGTPRALLLSRLNNDQPGRPRDIDIVMDGPNLDDLRSSFESIIARQTRFGGLQLKEVNWQFDVWPLEETFAFKERRVDRPRFDDLPMTTFFNVEAIAIDVWPKPGHARRVFSSDDQFFRGVISRTMEINYEQNPFPELCVVRAMVMAANLRWKIGPRLLLYLVNHGEKLSPMDFEAIQSKHYGKVQWGGSLFIKAMEEVRAAIDRNVVGAVELTFPGQLTLWPEDDMHQQRIHLHTLLPEKSIRKAQ